MTKDIKIEPELKDIKEDELADFNVTQMKGMFIEAENKNANIWKSTDEPILKEDKK